MRTIDAHAHALPPSYAQFLQEEGAQAARNEGFPMPVWSPQAALALMDEVKIDIAVLSISSPHIHVGDDALATARAQAINEELADVCRMRPDCFAFCATLPLPNVDASIDEAKRSLDELGAVGVKVPSNANGVYLGDKRFWPLYEFLNERQAPMLIHPCAPTTCPVGCAASWPKPLFEFIADTTRSVLDLVMQGIMEHFEDLRVVVPHCGSFLPLMAGRLEGISRVLVPQGFMEPIDVRKSFDKLYFDVAGDALPTWLPTLLQMAEPGHMLYGSDTPYTPASAVLANKERLLASPELTGIQDEVFHGNAERLFGLDL